MLDLNKANEMKTALSGVFAALNILGGRDAREASVVEVFRTSHRTLQQQFVMGVILPILRHLAKNAESGVYDLRNEASCKLAQKMLAAVTEDEQYLPFI